MKNQLLVASLSLGVVSAAFGSVSFTGSYFQDFDGLGQSGSATLNGRGPHAINGILGSTGMEGWYGANFTGSSGNTEFKAHNGSLSGATGRGVVFFGADGSTDRALGALPTSNQISSFGVVLTNTSSQTFVALDVSFIGEQWRTGDANIFNVLRFSYGMGTSIEDATTTFTGLDFAAPNLTGGNVALDGNNAANQTAISDVITGLNWAPGQSIVLRWDIQDLTGQDNGLAIDNFYAVGIVPAPGALALLGVAGLVGVRRRRIA